MTLVWFEKRLRRLQLYQKETLAQVFSCEFCEIFKNTFFERTPSVDQKMSKNNVDFLNEQKYLRLKCKILPYFLQ